MYFLKVNKMVSHFIRITISCATHSVFKFQKSIYFTGSYWIQMIQFPPFSTQLGPDRLGFLSPLHSVKLFKYFLHNSMKFNSQREMYGNQRPSHDLSIYINYINCQNLRWSVEWTLDHCGIPFYFHYKTKAGPTTLVLDGLETWKLLTRKNLMPAPIHHRQNAANSHSFHVRTREVISNIMETAW